MDRKLRAQAAERLLNDELFRETFDALRAQSIKIWENSSVEDVAAREDAWKTLRLLDSMKKAFTIYAKQAKVDDQLAKVQQYDVDAPVER